MLVKGAPDGHAMSIGYANIIGIAMFVWYQKSLYNGLMSGKSLPFVIDDKHFR